MLRVHVKCARTCRYTMNAAVVVRLSTCNIQYYHQVQWTHFHGSTSSLLYVIFFFHDHWNCSILYMCIDVSDELCYKVLFTLCSYQLPLQHWPVFFHWLNKVQLPCQCFHFCIITHRYWSPDLRRCPLSSRTITSIILRTATAWPMGASARLLKGLIWSLKPRPRMKRNKLERLHSVW